ncbi:MAG: 2-oxoacid:acceptor oxidoreductase family protein [Candidatus Omnitrophica bacterium]|nr:2-oxoacid:acceptor oxidoreductase family protein [Candidatus Omnitrophota bacterium]MCM8809547.1 2-oxoacid:acceptor oxidoreductase family protein [Candidatus Omnitrophota bacterium]MCM8810728.1 2-oxoacid:acceptor oxidoreductase family protein [Candidatus Omnitrophota bacterium]
METINRVKIILGGSGGQGILTLGKHLAYAGMKNGYEVSCLPTYSAEMRGGYIYCFVTISKEQEIFSPLSKSCDIGVFLNDMSYKMLRTYLKKDSFIILNSSLIKNLKKNKKIFEIPATETAERIGDIRIANMVIAGAISKLISEKFFDFRYSFLLSEVEKVVTNENIVKLCKIAIKEGYNYLENLLLK